MRKLVKPKIHSVLYYMLIEQFAIKSVSTLRNAYAALDWLPIFTLHNIVVHQESATFGPL